MSKLVVDSRTLLAVRDGLGRLHDQLLGMPTVTGGYDGLLGSRALEAELEDFCGRWHHATTEVGGQIGELMGRLVGAAGAYQRIEDRITGAGHAARVSRTSSRPRSGSGTTTIGGRSRSWSGSGTTVIGGGGPSRSTSGSGTTVIGGGQSRSTSGSGTTVVGG